MYQVIKFSPQHFPVGTVVVCDDLWQLRGVEYTVRALLRTDLNCWLIEASAPGEDASKFFNISHVTAIVKGGDHSNFYVHSLETNLTRHPFIPVRKGYMRTFDLVSDIASAAGFKATQFQCLDCDRIAKSLENQTWITKVTVKIRDTEVLVFQAKSSKVKKFIKANFNRWLCSPAVAQRYKDKFLYSDHYEEEQDYNDYSDHPSLDSINEDPILDY